MELLLNQKKIVIITRKKSLRMQSPLANSIILEFKTP
jgi:hypothetical protein